MISIFVCCIIMSLIHNIYSFYNRSIQDTKVIYSTRSKKSILLSFFQNAFCMRLQYAQQGRCQEFHRTGLKYSHVEGNAPPSFKNRFYSIDFFTSFADFPRGKIPSKDNYPSGRPICKYWWVKMHPLHPFDADPAQHHNHKSTSLSAYKYLWIEYLIKIT